MHGAVLLSLGLAGPGCAAEMQTAEKTEEEMGPE